MPVAHRISSALAMIFEVRRRVEYPINNIGHWNTIGAYEKKQKFKSLSVLSSQDRGKEVRRIPQTSRDNLEPGAAAAAASAIVAAATTRQVKGKGEGLGTHVMMIVFHLTIRVLRKIFNSLNCKCCAGFMKSRERRRGLGGQPSTGPSIWPALVPLRLLVGRRPKGSAKGNRNISTRKLD